MLVTAAATGSSTLVASSRPPSPTSTTAVSTPASAKQRKAIAVVASKKVAPLRSIAGRSRSAADQDRPLPQPAARRSRIRSAKETRCGEV